ncbi:MAG: DUF72 domain-containing protein [Desulfobacterales bacterium]|jgi:uncharacterized protein YecE (DUF72 family)
MKIEQKIHIGTSGWRYEHWRGPFYPEGLSTDAMLAYYSRHLQTVEVNRSFYQLPQKDTFLSWRDTCHPGFNFTIKAHRYITHMKKLKDATGRLSLFLERIKVIDYKLGPILFQLPSRWRFNAHRLNEFLEQLPGDYRYAFEFRDPSWYNSRTYEALSRYGTAFCIYDLAGHQSPKEITTNFVYVRLYGTEEPYRGKYDDSALIDWAGHFYSWAHQGKEIFCYFDNDKAGYAVKNALKLHKIINS